MNIKPRPIIGRRLRSGRIVYDASTYRRDYNVVMGLTLFVVVTALYLALVGVL